LAAFVQKPSISNLPYTQTHTHTDTHRFKINLTIQVTTQIRITTHHQTLKLTMEKILQSDQESSV